MNAMDKAASVPVDKRGDYVCPVCGEQSMSSWNGPCRACGADADDVEAQEPRWWEDRP